MHVTISEQEGRLVAALIGDFDNVASAMAERDLAPVFDNTDCDVVIDCTELDYISSSGLRILLNIYKHTRKTAHHAILRNVSDDVEEVLRTGGFLQLYQLEKA